jgi:hypothetical protein
MQVPARPSGLSRPSAWPLVVALCGLPLWWVLGLFSIVPLLASVPMAWQLARMPTVHLPRGFGWWVLFLLWVVLGLGVLWADAPGAVPGGGPERLLVFGYRLWWYAACTVVVLWVANLSREVLSDRLVLRLGGTVFVVTMLGGILGVLRPELEFRSLLELVLPGGLRHNGFVSSLVHPQAAEIQSVLGRPEPRPKAPFPFTNSWGSGLSLSLVFFVAALRGLRPALRVVGVGLVLFAAVPVLYSLNRGLWVSLAVGAVGLGLLVSLRRPVVLGAVVAASAVVVGVVTVSPWGTLVQERMDHQHSNGRRTQLLVSTVSSVSAGSPVVGFGTTRDVQGSFASIAGAATPDCPACGVPPLGTQGQLWLVVFSQGWLGLAFFLVFVLLALSRCWRCRTTNQTVCTFVLAFFLIQLAIYDSLGLSLFLVMLAMGLVFREERLAVPVAAWSRPTRTATAAVGRVRGALPTLVLLAVGGGLAGAVVAATQPARYEREVRIELVPAPVALQQELDTSGNEGGRTHKVRSMTLDTESALLRSPASLTAAARAAGSSPGVLDRATTVTAVPSSWVLTVQVRAPTSAAAVRDSDAVTEGYLSARETWLAQRRSQLSAQLENQLAAVARAGRPAQPTRERLVADLATVSSQDASAGRLLSASAPERTPTGRQQAVTSGVALGVLAGCIRMHTRRRT